MGGKGQKRNSERKREGEVRETKDGTVEAMAFDEHGSYRRNEL